MAVINATTTAITPSTLSAAERKVLEECESARNIRDLEAFNLETSERQRIQIKKTVAKNQRKLNKAQAAYDNLKLARDKIRKKLWRKQWERTRTAKMAEEHFHMGKHPFHTGEGSFELNLADQLLHHGVTL